MNGEAIRDLPKNDPRKQGLAWLFRTRTTMKHAWIIQQLGMGTWGSVHSAVKAVREAKGTKARRLRSELTDLTF